MYQQHKKLKWSKSLTPSTLVMKDRSSYSRYIPKLTRLVMDTGQFINIIYGRMMCQIWSNSGTVKKRMVCTCRLVYVPDYVLPKLWYITCYFIVCLFELDFVLFSYRKKDKQVVGDHHQVRVYSIYC